MMKKLMMALLCGVLLAPMAAWGQTWVEPQTKSDGTVVEGHWQTQEDLRDKSYSTPGKVNPYSGQFVPFTDSYQRPQPVNPPPRPFEPIAPPYTSPDYKVKGW